MNNDEKKNIIFKQYWIEKLNTDDNSDKDFIFIQCQMIVYKKWNQGYIIVNVLNLLHSLCANSPKIRPLQAFWFYNIDPTYCLLEYL